MIDIVIPFINSINGDQELIYALRSAEKFHGDLIGDVYVVGDKFRCLLDVRKIKHIPFKQMKVNSAIDFYRDHNMLKKIILAATHCSENFFIWHDDDFILSPILGYYHQGHSWRGAPDTNYGKLEQNTKEVWPVTFNYDVHAPHLVNRDGIRKLQKLDWNKPCGYGIKTAYANLNDVDKPYEVIDMKFAAGFDYKTIMDRIQGRLFFSISDTAFKPPMIKVLNELFPNKSKWEC